MTVKSVNSNPNGTHKERVGSTAKWGENSKARPVTDKYKDGWDRIFGSKKETKPN
jgi:hypothetical protein